MEKRFKNTPEQITELLDNEIFVFGSNLEGVHMGGAAKFAVEKCGAIWGQSTGMMGNSWGIPTLSFSETIKGFADMLPLEDIKREISVLYDFAAYETDLVFFVTKIGTGIAGFSIEEIAQLFFDLEDKRPKNIILPIEFERKPLIHES